MKLKEIVSALGGDYEALMKEYSEIASTLALFGLSDYEARAYVALVAVGPASATSVAELAQIPRTSAYKVMESLERKGFAQLLQGKPRSFAPIDPTELSRRLAGRLEVAFSKIASVKDLLSERGVPQLVYTIMGRERVLDKIGEMLDKSQHTFVMSSPSLPEIRTRLSKRFSSAVARGVRVTVITSPFLKAPKGVEVTRRRGLIATDVISDGKTALLAAPDLSACGYTDNEALSRHLEDFLRIMGQSPG